MARAQDPPALHIPSSKRTVSVSIIDTTSYVANIPTAAFVEPGIPGFNNLSAPCYSMLIKHHNNAEAKGRYGTLLWDLGVRKDWHNGPASLVKRVEESGYTVLVKKDVAEILNEHGEDLGNIGGIIWSHYHWDHTGDPATFPASTDLIVGPGFKEAFVPAYPTKEDSPVDERAYTGRNLREIDFDTESKGLKLGRYRAIDFYGDGSFYLLDSPGHAIGHICALARTSAHPPEFIFLGGDVAHHACEFRPTQYLPLPKHIDPSPLAAPYKLAPLCPGSIFEAIHPQKSSTKPFVKPATTSPVHKDAHEAKESIDKLTEFDAYDNVFAVIAHDESLYDVVDFYPKPANGWKGKRWRQQGQWRFLRDFDTGNEDYKPTWAPSIRP